MSRLLPLAVFALVVAGIFVLPQPDPDRLAALHAGSILQAEAHALGPGAELELQLGAETLRAVVEEVRFPDVVLTVEPAGGGPPVERSFPLVELLPAIAVSSEAPVPGSPQGRPLWRYLGDLVDTAAKRPVARLKLLDSALMLGVEDHKLHHEMATSVLRALRAIGADEDAGGVFRVHEFRLPEPGVAARPEADFHPIGLTASRPTASELRLMIDLPDGRVVWGQDAFHPPDARSLLPPWWRSCWRSCCAGRSWPSPPACSSGRCSCRWSPGRPGPRPCCPARATRRRCTCGTSSATRTAS